MWRWIQYAGVLLLAAQVACGQATVSQSRASVAEQYLFSAANAERAQRGLPPLRWDESLYRAALTHAREMAERESISHQYPGEADLSERGRAAGARFSTIAENVAEAPTAVRIHDAWMHSEGHRANLLDSSVDSVGISVISRNGQLYAVQDFDRAVPNLSFEQQEHEVANLLLRSHEVELLPTDAAARQTCTMETGYAGERPGFVMRFSTGELKRLPAGLEERLKSGQYQHARIAACAPAQSTPFAAYNIAVLLYR